VTVVSDKASLLMVVRGIYFVASTLVESVLRCKRRPFLLRDIAFVRFSFCVLPSCYFVLGYHLHVISFLCVTIMQFSFGVLPLCDLRLKICICESAQKPLPSRWAIGMTELASMS
jgi:hypothetical protein